MEEEEGAFKLSQHHKVVSIAAGESHTLALTGDGKVYSWGRGMFGRLGNASEEDQISPLPLKFQSFSNATSTTTNRHENSHHFVAIAAGAYHSLALSDDGSVWCWGYNIYGQLGMNGENSVVPRMMDQFQAPRSPDALTSETETKGAAPLKACSVKAGGMMSLAIDNLGALWMWGNCPQATSETEDGFSLLSSFTPIPVWDFHGHTVVKVACGNEHVVALVSAGEVYKGEDLVCYSWGNNNHGQLGLGDTKNRLHPEIVETFNEESPWAVYEVACGAFHTALLTHKKRPNNSLQSVCWTFGLGDRGQLGHGTTQSALKPQPVKELPEYVYLVSIDCGLFHTSVVSSAGDVWSWGMEKGLGLCPDATFSGTDSGDAISPLLISGNGLRGSKFSDPIQVACGAAHTVLVANNGYKLWSWGRGRSGVLGNGKTTDCYAPTIVLWPPLTEDFCQQESKTTTDDNLEDKASQEPTETDKRLSSAMEEVKLLQSKLSTMERYSSILHGSIFGKPFTEQDLPLSLRNSGYFDIAKEWEDMLESADRSKLVRMEMFYRNMLSGVKDKLLKRRIQELMKECLPQSNAGREKQFEE